MSDKRNHDAEEKIVTRIAPELSEDIDLIVRHLEQTGGRRHGAITRARAVRYAIAKYAERLAVIQRPTRWFATIALERAGSTASSDSRSQDWSAKDSSRAHLPRPQRRRLRVVSDAAQMRSGL